MVHVKKCPLGQRGLPTTEFIKDGVPQTYCYGYIDPSTDEPIKECANCKDYAHGKQMRQDFEAWQTQRSKQ